MFQKEAKRIYSSSHNENKHLATRIGKLKYTSQLKLSKLKTKRKKEVPTHNNKYLHTTHKQLPKNDKRALQKLSTITHQLTNTIFNTNDYR